MTPKSMKIILCTLFCMFALMLSGCVGRTGKAGVPITERYNDQIKQLEVGKSTPAELKKIFTTNASLQSAKDEIEIWEVFRGGNVDVAQFLLWGQIAHDKDQRILFTFKNGLLTEWHSEILPDPEK